MTVLHDRPFRSVRLERGADGAPRVVKHFHHPGRLAALLDGRRARREFAALQTLSRAGLAVPAPFELRSTERGWELAMQAIPEARALKELLDGALAPPAGWPRLCARLGELLARLHAAGWEHRDLHAGNVLVDAQGKPWLIDLQRARPAPPRARRLLADVTRCEALGRETVPARARARFLLAWLRALPAELRPRNERMRLAGELAEQGRAQRRSLVVTGLGRWLRSSSRARVVARACGRVVVRRDLDDAVLHALESAAGPAQLEQDPRWLVVRGSSAELRSRWLGAARLSEHGLPVTRPALFAADFARAPQAALALFERPTSSPCATPAELRARLAERGLVLEPFEAFVDSGPSGCLLLAPPERALRSSAN